MTIIVIMTNLEYVDPKTPHNDYIGIEMWSTTSEKGTYSSKIFEGHKY